MKTFYASVECAERGLNPFDTNLVVADETRGENALCLAISPKMKSQGVKNRCRLSDIPKSIKYMIVPPRMKLYIDYAADIYGIYIKYINPKDIHVYSIDESFIDVTDYLPLFKKDKFEFAKFLIDKIAINKRIPSTCGIGTNLYLAKIALDITAKKSKEHMGYLNENLFIETLWDHRPITDFWGISTGTKERLAKIGIYDMRGIANMSTDTLYRIFGINAEILIDHAWGRESCLIEDIKAYKSKSKSVSFSQILSRDYSFDEAKTVLREMIQNGCYELMRRHVITNHVEVWVGYTFGSHQVTKGSSRMTICTALSSKILPYALDIYEKTTDRTTPIRQIGIAFDGIMDECQEGYDLFSDWDEIEKEKKRESAIIEIYKKYGKNAILRGTSYFDESTQRERNSFIGGHRAGE